MRRATTPTHTFVIPEAVAVSSLEKVLLTYSQNGVTVLEKTLSDLAIDSDKNSLYYELTQNETNLFAPGKALIQLRVKTNTGAVLESQMLCMPVKPALNSEVI